MLPKIVQFLAEARDFSLLPNIKIISAAHPLGGHELNSPPFSAEVKNAWQCTSTPLYAFMACTETTPSLLLSVMLQTEFVGQKTAAMNMEYFDSIKSREFPLQT